MYRAPGDGTWCAIASVGEGLLMGEGGGKDEEWVTSADAVDASSLLPSRTEPDAYTSLGNRECWILLFEDSTKDMLCFFCNDVGPIYHGIKIGSKRRQHVLTRLPQSGYKCNKNCCSCILFFIDSTYKRVGFLIFVSLWKSAADS